MPAGSLFRRLSCEIMAVRTIRKDVTMLQPGIIRTPAALTDLTQSSDRSVTGCPAIGATVYGRTCR